MSNSTNTVVVAQTNAPGESKSNDEVCEQFSGVLGTLSSFRSQITMLQNQVRALEKTVGKHMLVKPRKIKIKVIENHLDLRSPLRFQMNYVYLCRNPKVLVLHALK